MSHLKPIDCVALVLVIVGGLNWGLVGLFDFNLVDAIFGEMAFLSRLIYVLVGVSALYAAIRSPYLAHLRGRRTAPPHTPHPAG